tara:strand:- start:1301 stop:1954 length:654 start_codon:yes stop_codon:yes gene_type:complete
MSKRVSIREVFDSITEKSCPESINFHSHTTCSDGSLSPIELISQATERGLQHLAVTDHHSVESYRLINEWLLNRSIHYTNNPKFWSGIEISCLLRNKLIHLIGIDFDISHRAMKPYIQKQSVVGKELLAEYVVESIHDAGGLAILAHPARYNMNCFDLIDSAFAISCDGAEAWYDYSFNKIWKPTPYICESINLKLKSLDMLSSCGTDTHGFSLGCR